MKEVTIWSFWIDPNDNDESFPFFEHKEAAFAAMKDEVRKNFFEEDIVEFEDAFYEDLDSYYGLVSRKLIKVV